MAAQRLGWHCVLSSEIDKFAARTYHANFGEWPSGDVRALAEIPELDVVCAGFPCQPFSKAGRREGMRSDKGTLFFEIARIVGLAKPRAIVLENVPQIVSCSQGKTLETIVSKLSRLGYSSTWRILDSEAFVPQKRRRFFLVALRDGEVFDWPEVSGSPVALRTALDDPAEDGLIISDRLWEGHRRRAERHARKGNGYGYVLADLDSPAPTIVARYGNDGKECLIPVEGQNPRKLSPRECARLFGFPDTFKIVCSRSQAYKQFGNSVVVPIVEIILSELDFHLSSKKPA